MAGQRNDFQEMMDDFAMIIMEDEKIGGITDAENDEGLTEIDTRWCLVGRFLTDSSIDFQLMQHKMASLWRPGKGMYVKQLEANRFLLQLYHELDITRVCNGSPWTFRRFHLVFVRLRE